MTIKLLRDLVLVRRVEYRNPLLEVIGVKLDKGVVVSTGPGRYVKRKVRYAANPNRPSDGYIYFEDGAPRVNKDGSPMVRPMRVKVGDVVEFSPRQQTTVEVDGESLVLIPEQAIYWTSDDSQSSVILEQRSAGISKAGDLIA